MLDLEKVFEALGEEGHSTNMSEKKPEWQNRNLYSYINPMDADHLILGDRIINEIISTKAFQRLKYIKFLGGIDYTIVKYPNRSRQRYTRYQHSLGVAQLAALYACVTDLNYKDRRMLYVSALLHDIGHAPLSHSLEDVFSERFGIDHHIATENIIRGKSILGTELVDILNWHGINVEGVIALINRQDDRFDKFFSGPINFDTIEGILRTYSYVRNSPLSLNPHVVTYAAAVRRNEMHKDIVDEFWRMKGLVYSKIISSRIGVLADFVCKSYMIESIKHFSVEDYYITETKLFRKLPGLRETLINEERLRALECNLSDSISYNKRGFYVDASNSFYSKKDELRYRQDKKPSKLLPRMANQMQYENAGRSMFDDESF
ncbi:HD domain-containing protein [Methylorubrum thiocyanatum]|uniref:HD domain-containing protein n=1 Tax=Methylorubrum thiocyanatum TaxID=47958 RepID=UPI003F7FAA6C